jgi:TRAP-type C4-dicarboxylate transport system permease large subunit
MTRSASVVLAALLFFGLPASASADSAADARAANAALQRGDYDETIRLTTAALDSGTLPVYLRSYTFIVRGLAFPKDPKRTCDRRLR